MRALFFLTVAACCGCSRRPPAPAAATDGWRRTAVPECGFSVELPGNVRRLVDVAAGVSTTLYEAPESSLMAECTVFPPEMELPPAEEFLRAIARRHEHNVDGLGGGITGRRLEIEQPSKNAARLQIDFRNGKQTETWMVLWGRQLHEMTATLDREFPRRAGLDRLIASYRRDPRPSP